MIGHIEDCREEEEDEERKRRKSAMVINNCNLLPIYRLDREKSKLFIFCNTNRQTIKKRRNKLWCLNVFYCNTKKRIEYPLI